MAKSKDEPSCSILMNLTVKLKDGDFRIDSSDERRDGLTVDELGRVLDAKLGSQFGDKNVITGYVARVVIMENTSKKKAITKASDEADYTTLVTYSEVLEDIWHNFNLE